MFGKLGEFEAIYEFYSSKMYTWKNFHILLQHRLLQKYAPICRACDDLNAQLWFRASRVKDCSAKRL